MGIINTFLMTSLHTGRQIKKILKHSNQCSQMDLGKKYDDSLSFSDNFILFLKV